MKNCEKRCFARVWTSFGLWSNLGLTRGILVILAEKRHFKCSGAQMGFATLTKFDSKLTSGGPKNPNFDLAFKTG